MHAPHAAHPVAKVDAQPEHKPAEEQLQLHEAPADEWVHVSLPAAEGPAATTDAVAAQSGGLISPAPSVLAQVRLRITCSRYLFLTQVLNSVFEASFEHSMPA